MFMLKKLQQVSATLTYAGRSIGRAAGFKRHINPSVAVCLVTCDRYEYTKKTVETFIRYNDVSRFQLLHADDASQDERVCEVVNACGFVTVHRSTQRQGNTSTIRNLVGRTKSDWVLLLENDWESVRSFPWDLFEQVLLRPDIYCLRLCGRYKERDGRPFSDQHAGRNNSKVVWESLSPGLETAYIHWGHPPAITRFDELRWLLAGAQREKDSRMRSGKLDLLTARVSENVFYHIGQNRTPEFQR